jgi:outer membrane protein W
MTIPLLLLTTVFAGAHQDRPAATPSVASPAALSVRFDQQRQRQQREVEPRDRRTGERPHTVGIGSQMALSNRGAGGSMRTFLNKRLGLNLAAGWYPNGRRYTSNAQSQGSTFAAMPSFMLTTPNPMRDVDIRPYVGGGVNYVRSMGGVTTTATSGASNQQRRSGTGGQAFGGIEMTFREADMITISAEGIYYSLPVSYVNSSVVGGFNYLLAFHFYLK